MSRYLLLLCLFISIGVHAATSLTGTNWRAAVDDEGRLVSFVIDETEMLQPFPDGAPAMKLLVENAPIAFTSVSAAEDGRIVCDGESFLLTYAAVDDALVIGWRSKIMQVVALRWRMSAAVTAAYDGEDDTFVNPHDTWYDDMVDARIVTADGPLLRLEGHGFWTRDPYTAQGAPCFGTSVYPRNESKLVWHAESRPSSRSALVFEVRGENDDFLPPGGRPARFPCAVKNLSQAPLVFGWKVEVVRFPERSEVLTAEGALELAAGAEAIAPVELALSEPGIYQARLSLIQSGQVSRGKVWNFCHDFAGYQPECPRPEDFDAFWTTTLAELAKIPPDLKREEIARTELSILYTVSFQVFNGERASAWLRVPLGDGPFPARLELPPSGVNALPPPGESTAIEMKVAIHGFDVDKSDFPAQPPYPWPNGRYHNVGLASRESYFYRNVYARCWRAVDMLQMVPEIDAERIMVFGGSQGGGLSIVTAAFRPQVALAAPGFPGLCRLDWTIRDGIGSWPLSMDDIPEGQSLEQMLHTLSYFDVANFIGRVRCPIVGTIGWMDNVTGAAGQIATFAQADKSRLTLFCAPWGRHGASSRTQQLFYRAHREFLQGQPLSLPATWTDNP